MTAEEAASMIGCKPGLVYKLCAHRKLRHTRVGFGRGMIVITEEAVREYLASREVEPVPDGGGNTLGRARRKRTSGAPVVRDYVAEYERKQRERKLAGR
jgi:excisionase family DNA binding protein